MILRGVLIACFSILFASICIADSSDYMLTVKDNGEALVIITINGTGLYKLHLQDDVRDIRVKGALYNVNNGTATISIGSTEKAVVLYKTSMLTTKAADGWMLQMELVETNQTKIRINLPENSQIIDTEPDSMIEQAEYKKIIMEGKLQEFSVNYGFSSYIEPLTELANASNTPDFTQSQATLARLNGNYNIEKYLWITAPAISVAAIAIAISAKRNSQRKKYIGFRVRKKKTAENTANNIEIQKETITLPIPKASEGKSNIIKTLPKNEETIINHLLENRGSLKRNLLEKKSLIAKSSLASSLANLEKKKIVEIDRTYTTHFVKLTKWFEEL